MNLENNRSFIQCRKLSKTYHKGNHRITPLESMDLDVQKGEFLALMGPSGSGKTTLLNLIAGIDSPSSGTLKICGKDLSHLSRSLRTDWRAKNCGYIFQMYHLIPILTAYENVELPLLLNKSLNSNERRKKVHTALEIVGLSDRADHNSSELSGGQEQRVAIARAIVGNPSLLVADEPTGDLDRESASQILKLLKDLAIQHGKTILMVTHDALAAKEASRTLHLQKGKLLARANPQSSEL
mgnify:CR=1 FL=1|jgi:putative ABC transport system ATP-binding protein